MFDVKGMFVFDNLLFLLEVIICYWMKFDKNFVRWLGYFYKFYGGSWSLILLFIKLFGDGGIFFRMEISLDGKKLVDC